MEFDILDAKILSEIADNAKKPYADIGRKLKTHPNVISYRLNRMKRCGIIRNFTVDLDLEKMGLNEQAFVAVNFPPHVSREDALREIIALPQTLYIVNSLGMPESLIFLASKNKTDLDVFISKLKSLNVEIAYTSPIIKIYRKEELENLLRYIMSNEIEEKEKVERKLENLITNIEPKAR